MPINCYKLSNGTLINAQTGEVINEYGKFVPDSIVEEQKQRAIDNARIYNTPVKNTKIKFEKFMWILFNYKEDLFPEISSANLAKIIFISTYCKNDGSLKYDNFAPMNKESIQKRLNLSKSSFNNFWSKMCTLGIFYKENNLIKINDNYFCRGKISIQKLAQRGYKNFTRLYIKNIRYLYNNTPIRYHAQLGYLYRMIPYVNFRYNIVCANPQEPDIEKIIPLTLSEICDVIGYNKANACRLKDIMYSYHSTIHKMRIVGFVYNGEKNDGTLRVFINPLLYYSGDMVDEVLVLCAFC